MHIKQLLIEGFRSYKEQVETETFSPKVNTIVGANGSGKSNFFQAIRFVLSDDYASLRAEDRQKLLHEGSGHAVMSAFVEIVFDNSDGRLPIEKDEVRLRRTIGLKKDEYQLDRKSITRTEVQNLLESAGFSRSNPYYIVQQGKINALATMTDTARLALLKEIAGTKVYEDRRKESLRIMNETEIRRREIEEVVQDMEERLENLRAEKEELASYQDLDKQRRSVEFTMFDKELSETRAKLEELDIDRQEISSKSASLHENFTELSDSRTDKERELKETVEEIERLLSSQTLNETERADAFSRATGLELDVSEFRERASRGLTSKENIQKELDGLEVEIANKKKDLDAVTAEFDECAAKESEATKREAEVERDVNVLYEKESRGQNFSSVADRDKWIKEQIKQRKATHSKAEAQLGELQNDAEESRGRSAELERELAAKNRETASAEEALPPMRAEIDDLVKVRNQQQNAKRRLERENLDTQTLLERHGKDKKKILSQLERVIPMEINRGLNSVQNISKNFGVEGVHGTLMELFTCKENINTAVEITAGNSLFHVVTDTDSTASTLLDHLNRDKGGRVTCIPLNRVHAPRVEYPDDPNVVPMMKLLKYDDSIKDAMSHVFGKTLVCRNIDIASEMSKQTGLNCVTPEGEQVDRKGAMTGGYYDQRASRISTFSALQEMTKEEEGLRIKMQKESEELQKAEQDITITLDEKMKKESEFKTATNEFKGLREECVSLKEEATRVAASIIDSEKHISAIQTTIEGLAVEIKNLEDEIGTPLTKELTSGEQKKMTTLQEELQQLQKTQLPEIRSARVKLEARKVQLEASLQKNLQRRQSELQTALEELSGVGHMNLESRSGDLDSAKDAISNLESKLSEIAEALVQKRELERELESQCESLQMEEGAMQAQIQDQKGLLEKLVTKRAGLLQRRDDLMRKIRELGSVPSETFDQHQSKSVKELQKLLSRTLTKLKKFGNVNKKALDQFINFTEQRDELHQRREELNKSETKIRELIGALDHEKDEAIERTFRQVAMHFQEVFKELVHDGQGEMVMVKKLSRATEEQQDAEDEDMNTQEEGTAIEKYSGVRIKVSFGLDRGEVAYLNQLSGGQKTVVALALILAIQKCDPAPFYLFDEIDANLDAMHRTAVAQMIRKQAANNNTQFIATTFKPELVRASDQIFGVSMTNKVSMVDVVDVQDALTFVERDAGNQQE